MLMGKRWLSHFHFISSTLPPHYQCEIETWFLLNWSMYRFLPEIGTFCSVFTFEAEFHERKYPSFMETFSSKNAKIVIPNFSATSKLRRSDFSAQAESAIFVKDCELLECCFQLTDTERQFQSSWQMLGLGWQTSRLWSRSSHPTFERSFTVNLLRNFIANAARHEFTGHVHLQIQEKSNFLSSLLLTTFSAHRYVISRNLEKWLSVTYLQLGWTDGRIF